MPCQTDNENDAFQQIPPVAAGTPSGEHAVSPADLGQLNEFPRV